jgi:alanyl-tRNA synthetase
MTSNEIRKQFLEFFKSKKHVIVPSAPLVVKDDPTLMFINSGMAPFKDIFLGNKPIEHPRIANTQKCLRVSGKHNDLEEVGVDTYHHTMFEMLGNWSFGDYFKKEAIEWSWELLTHIYQLDKSRLYVTVFEGDEKENIGFDAEAYNEWKKHIPEKHILKGSKKDNFWEMGDTGPCGPCSEIHYDLRSEEERAKTDGSKLVNAGHPLVVEIWNLVFMQYERKADGSLKKLAQRHVDTGMGFERLCVAIQGKTSNYDTDVFTPLIRKIEQISGKKYHATTTDSIFPAEAQHKIKSDIAIRVIADHIRAVAFTIADGQLPGNTGAGYIIRRILRRAVRYGYSHLGFDEPFLYLLTETLAHQMGAVFPEIVSRKSMIEKVIQEEETAFFRTLKKGMERLQNIIETLPANNKVINGKEAFELFDTYGFPLDLTKLIAKENGLTVDEEAFESEMAQQKSRSREASHTAASDWVELLPAVKTEFVGYDQLETESRIVKYRKIVQKNKELYQLVLDKTPFYPESGGQIGDKGLLTSGNETLEVLDTKKENDLVVHFTNRLPMYPEAVYHAAVNLQLRNNTTKNHSATHLLHAALRQVLGNHVEQKGSLVTPDYLRFDFSHFSKVTDEQIKQIEHLVNSKILENIQLDERREIPISQAKAMGAMALFGEKYGEKVRVIIFDKNFSVELCGGCHVQNTGQIGFFKITSESSIAAGIRRMEAVTGWKAIQLADEAFSQLAAIRVALNNPKDILQSIATLKQENELLKKQLQQYEDQNITQLKKEILQQITMLGSVKFYASPQIKVSSAEALRKLGMQLTQELKNDYVLLLAASIDHKNLLHLRIAPSLKINANQLLKELAPSVRGGGPSEFVQAHAGSKTEIEKLIVALQNKFSNNHNN